MLDGSHEVQPAVRLKCPRGGGDAPWLGSWLADVRRRPSAARLWRSAAAYAAARTSHAPAALDIPTDAIRRVVTEAQQLNLSHAPHEERLRTPIGRRAKVSNFRFVDVRRQSVRPFHARTPRSPRDRG